MLLDVQTITKRYGQTTAVDHVSLALQQGEILCLLGPSGCGKTTLLRLIAGLEQPDSGSIFYEGREVTAVPPHKRGFGMMFQNYALFPHKNVYENIAFGLEMRGDSQAAINDRVTEMLDLVDLEGFGEREVDRLSGGEQQRVALARALAPDPQLLMLDEPLGALDRALRERLMVELREIIKRVGVTAVYVTHDQTEALAISDRVAVMRRGQIVQIDPPRTLFDAPNSPFVARFLGFHNILEGKSLTDGRVELPFGVVQTAVSNLPPNQPTAILLKPEAATFADSKEAGDQNQFLVEVREVGFYGRFHRLLVQPIRSDGTPQGHSLRFEPEEAPYQVGQRLTMTLAPDEVYVFPQ